MSDEFIEMQLSSSKWTCEQADQLIKQWRACKTEHARRKLIPRLEEIRRRLVFERNGIDKLIGPHNEGEEWKQG